MVAKGKALKFGHAAKLDTHFENDNVSPTNIHSQLSTKIYIFKRVWQILKHIPTCHSDETKLWPSVNCVMIGSGMTLRSSSATLLVHATRGLIVNYKVHELTSSPQYKNVVE